VNEEIQRMRDRLEALAPGVRERIKAEKVAALTAEERESLDIPDEELTPEMFETQMKALAETAVSHREVAEAAPPENQETATRLAGRLADHEELSRHISQYRSIVNYDYWEIRCEAEQTKTAVDARKCIYDARKLEDQADLEAARVTYEEAWRVWRSIFDQYPRLMDDVSSDDLIKSIRRYDRLLEQLDEDFPMDFPLTDFIGLREERDEKIAALYKKVKDATSEYEAPSKQEPDEPAKKPDEPAKKPDEPAEKPDEPAEKPDEPAEKPDAPAE
jgi:hypothetical protein